MNDGRISKAQYEAIRKDVSNWPEWKRNYVNEQLIISPKCKKLEGKMKISYWKFIDWRKNYV